MSLLVPVGAKIENLRRTTRAWRPERLRPGQSTKNWFDGFMGRWENGLMKMTLDIPDNLFREAKARAALEGRKLKDLVADSLRAMLGGTPPRQAKRRVEFPIVKGKGETLRLTGDEIAEIEAKEEAEYYARFMRR